MITNVNNNLGDRAGGTIGSASVDSVVLAGINIGLPQCVKLANPTYYDQTMKMVIASGSATEFDIPDLVIGGTAHRIKDIVHMRTSRVADGTPITIQKKTYSEFLEVSRDYDQQLEGIPAFIAFREGKGYINRVPSEAYNLTLFVEVWPATLTTEDLNTPLPIDPEWQLCVEAYTSYYVYLKLQQKVIATFWKETFEEQKAENSQVKRKTDIRGQGKGGMVVSGNVFLNPFVLDYRTSQN
jgi:hypothetical protein